MRIISGTLKGKSINFLKNSNTRPLKDSIRENIFNILKHSNQITARIEDSNILDLYAGIGSFGIESISRGAKKVTFIEQDKNATNILRENLNKLSVFNKAKILNTKIEDYLKDKLNEKFNIFFFDPPFIDFNFIRNLEIIKKNKIFAKNHVVVIHREKRTIDNYKNLIKITDTKHYGRSKIIFGIFN